MIDPLTPAPHKQGCIALALLAAACAPMLAVQPLAAAESTPDSPNRLSYILFSAGTGNTTMNGSTDDIRHAQSFRNGREALLYVRYGGTAYVIRDAATLRQAEIIFEPQQALGARQAELGSRQAALGRRQAQLGEEQARLGRQQANATPARAGELGRQQNELGRRQGALGQEQAVLGRQQNALGREQARLGRVANGRIRALIEDAVRRGVAQRVN